VIAYRFEVEEWGAGLLHYDADRLIDLEEPAQRTRTGTRDVAPAGASELAQRVTAFLRGAAIAFDDVDCSAAYDAYGLTDLERRMVEAVRTIPYGETASYREIAELAGQPRAFQAGSHSLMPVQTYLLSVCRRAAAARLRAPSAMMAPMSSMRLLVVMGSAPESSFWASPAMSSAPQPPGPGLPRQAPSV
jgi:hypothetical protein